MQLERLIGWSNNTLFYRKMAKKGAFEFSNLIPRLGIGKVISLNAS